VEYWINRGFDLSGTTDKNFLLASNPRKRQYVLIRFHWISDEYRQHSPIVHDSREALAWLSEPASVSAAA
jgi:hypothetical protein